jgi:hypothetical protein
MEELSFSKHEGGCITVVSNRSGNDLSFKEFVNKDEDGGNAFCFSFSDF